MQLTRTPLASYQAEHFRWQVDEGVATVTLDRPERKNPLTFESYAELRDTFRALPYADDVEGVIVTGAGGNFSSGGDVHDIIGPLVGADMTELLAFTRMTGDLVKAIRTCPQPVLAAIDGVCVGAGAAIAMACDLRYGTPEARLAFLFVRVGLAGCDMGACSLLPRLVGLGRATDLLLSGRTLSAEEGERWGFYNRLIERDSLLTEARSALARLTSGPTFAHGVTKTMLNQEWTMSLEQALEAEAQAQALCMQTRDFERAYRAFVAGETPVFRGD